MALQPTDKCGVYKLDDFRQAGWTDLALLNAGYAIDVPEEPPAQLTVTKANGEKLGLKMPARPNAFNVTDLAEVHNLWTRYEEISNYPNGYFHSQHVLYVAEALARSRGLLK